VELEGSFFLFTVSILSRINSVRTISIYFFNTDFKTCRHLNLGLTNDLLRSGVPTKTLNAFFVSLICVVGRDSVAGIATHYELEGPRIEFWWRRHFPVFSLAGTTARACPWPLTQSSAEVKERVQLYLYSLFRSSLSVLGRTYTCQIFHSSHHLCCDKPNRIC
jgi:hypothetical protein